MSHLGWQADIGTVEKAMCHFITLAAPQGHQNAVSLALSAHGRVARMINNSGLANLLPQGAVQFLTTRTCDCGTVLGRRQATSLEAASAHAKEVARLKKKGWSDSKIARSLADKKSALATSTARKPSDSFQLWADVIGELLAHGTVGYVGLFLHFYREGLEEELVELKVRQTPPGLPIADALRSLEEDELVLFPSRSGSG